MYTYVSRGRLVQLWGVEGGAASKRPRTMLVMWAMDLPSRVLILVKESICVWSFCSLKEPENLWGIALGPTIKTLSFQPND